MALKDLLLPEQTIKTPGGEFTVRGLSLPAIARLIRERASEMQMLFEKYAAGDGTGELAGELGLEILEAAPDLVAEVIALAAGEYDEAPKVKRLPFPVQIEALEAVGRLTFDMEGGPKKVIETVIRVMRGTTDLMGDLRASSIGSLASAGR